MKKKLDWLVKNKILTLIVLAVCILFFVPLVLNFILTTPSNIGVVDQAHTGAWIGYYGAVLGGSLTLLGVWMTIQFQKESDKKEKAIQFKPILDIANGSNIPKTLPIREVGLNVPEVSNNNVSPAPKYISINKKRRETFFFTFQNKGRGETSNAVLKSFHPAFENIEWTEKHQLHSSHGEQPIGEIISKEYFKVLIHLPQYLLIKKEVDLNEELSLDTVMEIHYGDMFEETQYKYRIDIRFSIQLDTNNSEEISMDYLAVKASYTLDQVMPQREIAKRY